MTTSVSSLRAGKTPRIRTIGLPSLCRIGSLTGGHTFRVSKIGSPLVVDYGWWLNFM